MFCSFPLHSMVDIQQMKKEILPSSPSSSWRDSYVYIPPYLSATQENTHSCNHQLAWKGHSSWLIGLLREIHSNVVSVPILSYYIISKLGLTIRGSHREVCLALVPTVCVATCWGDYFWFYPQITGALFLFFVGSNFFPPSILLLLLPHGSHYRYTLFSAWVCQFLTFSQLNSAFPKLSFMSSGVSFFSANLLFFSLALKGIFSF